eukprot:CAMPEP_0194482544 /NCGR_PEP_ID=MMETSP0253-20130528/4445_1 /TAXON_ID=2966 /ORGANISM="Noctiluca scintillans" /LENGTH=232 /DNA_ID=CAMNT_0039322087 /DNA_START=40 /DNA_END=739 /DNA_ORIENTATION=+
MADSCVSQVLALLVLDTDGQRLAVKYSAVGRKEIWPTPKLQMAFEKRVITKLPKNSGSKTEVDVAVIDEFTVLHQSGNDVVICAVAANGENELVVLSLVEGVFSAISNCAHAGFLSSGLSKQFVLDNLADVLFILDEVTDEGIIMETEEELILNRIKMIDELESNSSAQADAVFQKATQNAKSKLLSSLMGGEMPSRASSKVVSQMGVTAARSALTGAHCVLFRRCGGGKLI